MSRFEHWIALGDTHGDMVHRPSLAAAFKFQRYWKATVRIAGGDHFDLRPLRRGASDDEAAGLNDDMEAGVRFLVRYQPTHYLHGNHEWRITEWLNSGNPLKQHHAQQLDKMIAMHLPAGCEVFQHCKDRGVLKYGNFSFVHGYASGLYALKKHVETYGNCIIFHIHSGSMYRAATHERAIGFSSGCLCQLNMDYNRKHLASLRQEHGFMYGYRDTRTDKLHVYQAYPVDGVWYFPTEMREFGNAI